MNDDDDPDDLKRTRDKESKKTKKQIKKENDTKSKNNEDKYENMNQDGKNKDGKNEHGNENNNMETGSTSEEANGITMIVMRPSLSKQAIMIKAILKENSILEQVYYLQHPLGGERLSSIQTGELMVGSNGTLKNRNIRRFYSMENVSAFSETTRSPWSRTCQGLFSWIFRSPVNLELILMIENVVIRGYTVSLVKIITLNYTNAQICFSTLQEEFSAGDESLNLIQAVGDNSYGLFGRSFRNFENSGSILIISDATKGRRLILATTPLSYLNDSRILFLVSQEAFTPEGVNLNMIQAAEDNSCRAIIVRTQLGALVSLEVLRIRCQPSSLQRDTDGKQSQGVLRTLRSRERPRDLRYLNQRRTASVLAPQVNVQANIPGSTTSAKEWSCAITGRSDSACGSAPFPQCKMKAKGPSPESSTRKGNITHSANLRLERNKELVKMNAALKPPRQMVHRNTLTATKGDDEMYISGTIAVHSKRSPNKDTLLKYPTQCTDTEGHAMTCDSRGRYESACQAESEDVGTQGESCKQPVMETGWHLYNTCEDVRDKKMVDGTNTNGNNGGARRKTTELKGEREAKLGTPFQCEEDLSSEHHNNAPGHVTRTNGDPDLGNQGGVRRRPVPKGTLRMHRTVLYAQCDEDLVRVAEYSRNLEEENRQMIMRLLCPRCSALPWSVVLIPCGHLLCSSCYQGQRSCPICLKRVSTFSHALIS